MPLSPVAPVPLPRVIANVHIQKSGGTSLYAACQRRCATDMHCKGACSPFFNAHLTIHELRKLEVTLTSAGIALDLVAIIRDPLARVLSEYAHILHNPRVVYQDQWDYLDARDIQTRGLALTTIAESILSHSHRMKSMTLTEFIELGPGEHPAHNRMMRYLSGLWRRGAWSTGAFHHPLTPPGPCCLRFVARDLQRWSAALGQPGLARCVSDTLRELQEEALNVSHALGASRMGALNGSQWTGKAAVDVTCSNLERLAALGLLEFPVASSRLLAKRLGGAIRVG